MPGTKGRGQQNVLIWVWRQRRKYLYPKTIKGGERAKLDTSVAVHLNVIQIHVTL